MAARVSQGLQGERLHVSLEAKARASELPPESAIVFVEVGEGLVAARGGQDHEILVLARLFQDLAVPGATERTERETHVTCPNLPFAPPRACADTGSAWPHPQLGGADSR